MRKFFPQIPLNARFCCVERFSGFLCLKKEMKTPTELSVQVPLAKLTFDFGVGAVRALPFCDTSFGQPFRADGVGFD